MWFVLFAGLFVFFCFPNCGLESTGVPLDSNSINIILRQKSLGVRGVLETVFLEVLLNVHYTVEMLRNLEVNKTVQASWSQHFLTLTTEPLPHTPHWGDSLGNIGPDGCKIPSEVMLL